MPFGVVNYVVLILYFLAMLAIGFWAGRRVKGEKGYFIAEGKIHYVLAGLSILGTYLSALTMMALPALSFGSADWTWTVQLPCLLLTAFVITRFVLPRYREAGAMSVYAFLEQRIHVSSRFLASGCYLALAIGRNGLILYLAALAFRIVTGADLATTIMVMGVVVTLYTAMGGMEGVIWTDAIQVVIFTLGAAVTIVFIFLRVWDAGGGFFAIANQYHKFRMFDGRLDLTQVVTLWLVLQTIFETLRIYGTQQDMTQRYMTTESTAKANRSVWLAILGYIPLGYAFYFVGTGLFVFYHVQPGYDFFFMGGKVLGLFHLDPMVASLLNQNRADAIYPYFIGTQMPAGAGGLVIAAFFAATMSTVSAVINSSSTVFIQDFYKRLTRTQRSDRHYLNVARGLTVLWGSLATVLALLLARHAGLAQIAWAKIMAATASGVLGLMALAFLPFRVNKWAALIGFGACYVCLFCLVRWTSVNFLLWPVIDNLVCFFVALGVDRLLLRMGRPDSRP